MKKITMILMAMALVGTALMARGGNMAGTWTFGSPKGDRSITFGKDRGRQKGSEFTLEFNRQGKVRINETGSVYFYRMKNGQLELTDKRKNFDLNRKNRIDVLRFSGSLDNGCKLMKYTNKGMGGSTSKRGYRMCKVESFPQPTYQREPYKF